MKTLQLNNYRDPDKSSIFIKDSKFTVWLNWDLSFSFSDKKKLNNFIADLNRFLNLQLIDINSIYCNTFLIYRDLWFFDDNTDTNVKLNDFISVEKQFFMIYKQANITARNYYVFKNIIDLCQELIKILNQLREICTQKKISITLQKIDANIYSLNRIKIDLLNYNQDKKPISLENELPEDYNYSKYLPPLNKIKKIKK